MLIAIDTATRMMSIALHDGDNILCEQTCMTDNRHTTDLAPAVRAMLNTCEVDMQDLVGLAVCVGPGSYTGVRIGVAFAKGMAAPRNLPVVSMTSLDIIAVQSPYQSGTGLVAVVPAGRGRIIVKSYRWRKGEWTSRAEPRLLEWDELFASIDGPAIITGEISGSGLSAIRTAKANGLPVEVAPAVHRLRRAGVLAEVAWDKLHHAGGDLSSFAYGKLTPVYVQTIDND